MCVCVKCRITCGELCADLSIIDVYFLQLQPFAAVGLISRDSWDGCMFSGNHSGLSGGCLDEQKAHIINGLGGFLF